MNREKNISEVLATLPLASASLAPLRAVREEHYGEPLPPIEFPVAAFSTRAIPRKDAWALWRELRREPRLDGLAAVVTTSDSKSSRSAAIRSKPGSRGRRRALVRSPHASSNRSASAVITSMKASRRA